jgi:ribonuclease T2
MAFGAGAGRKVRLDCESDGTRQLISELRINLEGDAMAATTIRDLINPARNAGAGCNGGVVDPPGEQ